MQELTITGRLGRDVEIRQTTSGLRFATMPVASDIYYNGARETNWFDVSLFNLERYEKILPHLKKGHAVYVVGELRVREYQGNDGNNHVRLSITADRIGFVQGDSQGNNNNSDTAHTTTVQTATVTTTDVIPDEIPVVAKKAKVTQVEAVASNTNDDDLPF